MKVCPKCGRKFTSDLAYCLEDGVALVKPSSYDPEQTLDLPEKEESSPHNYRFIDSYSSQETLIKSDLSKEKQNNQNLIKKLLLIGGILFGLIVVSIVGGAIALQQFGFWLQETEQPIHEPISPSKPAPTEDDPPRKIEEELDVKILDEIKDNYGSRFLKVNITNPSDSIIHITFHSVSLSFYEDDVKIKDGFATLELRYLKPRQTLPVWVNMHGIDKYTSVKLTKPIMGKRINGRETDIYPQIELINTEMSSRRGKMTLNYRVINTTYYDITGVVENQQDNTDSIDLFILFKDEKSAIVGIEERNFNNLRKGEKVKLEVQVGENDLFGKPETFEIIAINSR